MSTGVPIHSARRTVSLAAASLVVVEGVMTAFASVASNQTYVPNSDFDGTVIDTTTGALDLPRSITITRSSAASQYSTNDIVLTGKRAGVTVTENITQPDADGGDTLRGTQLFDYLTSVFIPANGGTGGSFQVGVQDIGAPAGAVFTAIRLHAAGQINAGYGDTGNGANAANTDSFASTAETLEPIAMSRLLTSSALAAPTAVDLTLYLP